MFVFKQIPVDLDTFDGNMILAVVGEDERPLRAANAWLDWRLYGSISELILRGLFHGRLGEKCLIPTYGKFKFDRLVLVGGGNLFDDSVYPTIENGSIRWNEIADLIDRTIQSLKVEKIGLSLPRFDLADHERALLKTLQASRLPGNTSLFMSRASNFTTPIGF
ncbi:MAG: cytosol aminopeptidase [Bacteriovoracaceae bacterium]|nr:cytosol aminopeptidase [Bacteriovoracaceae bacterium]